MLIAVLKLQMVNPAVFSGEIFDKISTELAELNLIENSYFPAKYQTAVSASNDVAISTSSPAQKYFLPFQFNSSMALFFLGLSYGHYICSWCE